MKKFILLFIIAALVIKGQELHNNFKHFTETDGLPSNVVRTLMQDSLGYIWIGTDNGVAVYNGYEFNNFTIAPNDTNFLQLPLTTSLFEDSKGNVWIGSVDGITRYNRNNKSFKLFSLSSFGLKYQLSLIVTDIEETEEGNIIFSVMDYYWRNLKNAIYQIDLKSNQLEELTYSNIDSTDFILSIIPNDNNEFFIAGRKGFGKLDYERKSLGWYPLKGDIPVLSMLTDKKERIWLGTYNHGLINYNLKDSTYSTFQSFNYILDRGDLGLWKIIYDLNKNILLATNNGLIIFDVKTSEISSLEVNPQNPSALHSPNLSDILVDYSGSIWIGNHDVGVSKYNLVNNNFKAFTAKVDDENSLDPGWVSTIFEFDENDIWLSNNSENLVRFNPIKETLKKQKLPRNFEVFEIIKTSNAEIILFGGGGVYKLDPEKWIFSRLKLPVDFSNKVVLTGLEVSNNSIWFGAGDGLYIYDKLSDAATKIDFENLGLGNNTTNQIDILKKDNKGNIWIGTPNGLLKYDLDSRIFSRIGLSNDPSKSLKTQDINSIYFDNDNNVWIGTWLGGLNKYDQSTGAIETFTQKEGLPSHSVQGIIGDEENGYLWLSTFNGISRFNIKGKTFSNFGVDDGIHSNLFADGSTLKTSKGLIIFGGSNGITVIDPRNIQKNLLVPKITITDLKIFNKSVKPGNNSVLSDPIYKTKKLILNHDENDIELNYFAAHYVNPQKNQYAYKLENYEDDWRYVGNQRSAIYPNLPPGNYTFHLKASNNNGVWNEEGIHLDIVIKKPWWKTFWAYGGYLVMVLGLLYSIRTNELNRQKKNTEIKESQLRAEAAELQARAVQAENDRQTKELEEARELQLSMLPKELPNLPNLDIAVYMKTATEVGGDYYDFHIGLDGKLTAVLGDATGHGMKAGTMVTSVKSLFNVLASNPNIVETFHEITNALKQMHLKQMSMCLTMLKICGDKVEMSAAGMPPVLIYKAGTQVIEEHVMKGMPLGAFSNFPYRLVNTNLDKGDTILLMSDGFPELFNDRKEMFGYKRARNLFEELAGKSPEDIISGLNKAGLSFVNDKDPDDDITFVVIKVI